MSMRLAVFDCDGTLIDSQSGICSAMETAFTRIGLAPPPRNTVRRAVGLSLPQAMAKLLPDAESAIRQALVEEYKLAFRSARESGALDQPLYEGILGVIERLHAAGWVLGVATGMSSRGLEHCLAAHGIAHHFTTLQTADDHPSKPHPAMLRAALDEADAAPADAVMIGDTVFDMAMAQDVGVRAIGVDWGYHEAAELLAAGAELVAADAPALGEYLLR